MRVTSVGVDGVGGVGSIGGVGGVGGIGGIGGVGGICFFEKGWIWWRASSWAPAGRSRQTGTWEEVERW